jgi:hypothetical protein
MSAAHRLYANQMKGGTMDQPAMKQDRPQGNFVMNLNFRRANKDAPPITGRISTPEDPETEFSFSAFRHIDKNGEAYWIGPVSVAGELVVFW